MTVQITIIGLGRVGASIGLAMAAQKNQITRVGHDKEPTLGKQAIKLGAIDQWQYNLPASVEKADVVILAIPVDEVEDTLKFIAPELKDGATVIDTSTAPALTSALAKEILTGDTHFATVTPTLSYEALMQADLGLESASADLFKGSLIVITAPSGTHESALELAASLVTLLGATPYFTDTVEASGLLGAVHALPYLTAAALLNTLSEEPGWRESRKLAGRSFAYLTKPVAHPDEAEKLGLSMINNRQNLIRLIDALTAKLRDLRDELERGDEAALTARLKKVHAEHTAWDAQRMKGDFEGASDAKKSSSMGDFFGRMLFGQRNNPPPRQGK